MIIERIATVEEDIEKIENSEQVFKIVKAMLGKEITVQEHFIVITLRASATPITAKILFKGTVDKSEVHMRDIFRVAIEDNATKSYSSTQPSKWHFRAKFGRYCNNFKNKRSWQINGRGAIRPFNSYRRGLL
jgi:hypothetical protein